MSRVDYDPTQFRGSAPYYLRGRPPYSAELGEVLRVELGLDGHGTLVDVGAGPGSVSLALGALFGRLVVVEPDPEMLAEARRNLRAYDADFVPVTAEQLPSLGLPPARAVAFGQSFHRVDRLAVADAVHDLLEPGGALLLITHDPSRPPADPGPASRHFPTTRFATWSSATPAASCAPAAAR